MFLSNGKSPTNKIKTKGNMNILWYQHKAQGGNSIISLKNKLPSVEILATIQHKKMIVQFELDVWSKLVIFVIILPEMKNELCPELSGNRRVSLLIANLSESDFENNE